MYSLVYSIILRVYFTWIILAILRLSLSIVLLHDLHDERFDFAYSVRNGKSLVAILVGGV